MSNRFAVISELRVRAIRLLARNGDTYFPYGPNDEKRRSVDLGNIWVWLFSGRRLTVSVALPECKHPGLIVYDSDRLFDYQNVHVIEHVVLPALRREMVLDDLASV